MTDPVTLDGEGQIGEFDEKRAENAVRELLIAVGEDPDREGLRETPARVARAYREIFAGLWQEPEDVLTTTFDLGHDEMVLVKDIEVFSTCEHHLVPFRGVAHVGYIPSTSGKITGLSKLARLVDVYARRPQVQERLTTQMRRSCDTGVHLLIGDGAHRGRGLGTELIRAVVDLVLAGRPACTRVLAEPDVRNRQSVAAFLGAGFRPTGEVDLPTKRAVLMIRAREAREQSP